MAAVGQFNGALAGKKGDQTGRNPTDRGKLGTKRHLLSDRNGIPLAVVISGANEHDSTVHEDVWDALILMPPNPKEVPQHVCEDKAYDSAEIRKFLKEKGYQVHIPKRGIDTTPKEGDPKYPARRWVIERTGSWHNRFRRLKIRYEVKAQNYLAFVQFANAIICFRSCHQAV